MRKWRRASWIAGLIIAALIVLTAGVAAEVQRGSYSYRSGFSSGSYTYSNPGNRITYIFDQRQLQSSGGYFSRTQGSRTYYFYYRPAQAPGSPGPAPNPVPVPAPAPQPSPAPQAPAGLTPEEAQMLNLLNQERARNGLSPLAVDPTLTRLARLKSQDMIDKGYFGHNSPTYGSPFDMMRATGVTYSTAGENLAGASTVDKAFTALLMSPGHRANMLNPRFTRVGIGIMRGGPYGLMITQLFTG